jgi:2-amino-4-hydroxy-6-hydroxymethyldihydropteridine diphosphokinase
MSVCYLALGSNLGDRLQHLKFGLSALEERGVHVIRTASVYSTEPKELIDQPWFLNTAIEAETVLEPEELMRVCQEIERARNRLRKVPNGPRSLDIDIILFGERVMQTSAITIPHPRYTQRRFVLEPLAEIAPEQLDPLFAQTVSQLLEKVEDNSTVDRIASPLRP